MRKQTEAEIKVGIFVTIGIGLIMLAILVLGSTENLLGSKNYYAIHFPSVDGLVTGAKVVLGGVQLGTVDSVAFDNEKRDIKVRVGVTRSQADWIREDTTGEIATQGVLGDKYISLSPGSPEKPALPEGADIPQRPGKDLSQFLTKSDALLATLNSTAKSLDHILRSFESNGRSEMFFQGMAVTAKNLATISDRLAKEFDHIPIKSTVRNLNSILEKINNGTGTVGALINDPTLYDDAKALVGQANRNKVIRNIVRQTIRKSKENEEEAAAPK